MKTPLMFLILLSAMTGLPQSVDTSVHAAAQDGSISKSQWIVQHQKSAMDDKEYVELSIGGEIANQMASGAERSPSKTPRLLIECANGKHKVGIDTLTPTESFGVFRNTEGPFSAAVNPSYADKQVHRVRLRFDNGKASAFTWVEGDDPTSLVAYESSYGLLKKLLRTQRILVEFKPLGQGSVVASFDLAGLSEAIEPYKTQCGVK